MHLLCHRCGLELTPGAGTFYIVRIEAFADPSPPALEGDDDGDDETAIEQLLDEAGELSEQELMDQVYRRLTLHLCWPCYRGWIENPAGQKS